MELGVGNNDLDTVSLDPLKLVKKIIKLRYGADVEVMRRAHTTHTHYTYTYTYYTHVGTHVHVHCIHVYVL